ncbi:hypothetical protein GCM10010129_17790 [Streptomyces fumigatiscleroticus]|nr:hypothetical protein GCM10010129_17790 [Streptomyces fumigatiscleroticus]
MYRRRRFLGTYLGVALATLFPGISLLTSQPPWEVVLGGAVFLIVNQLIYSYPSAVRAAPLVPLLLLAVIGLVQDTLIWFLVSWISSQLDYGLHVDGFLAALLGGAVVRATVLVCIAVGPQPAPQPAS